MNWVIKIISKTLITKISYISWGITTKAFTVLSADRYSSVANQVGVGWNMISYTDTGLYFQFRASKNFQSFSSSQTIEFGYTEGFTGILGGYRSGNLFT